MEDGQVKRYSTLFRGNTRSFGQWDPKRPKNKSMVTLKEAEGDASLATEHFEKHLQGEIGIGIVPIRDDGMAWWGAIDVDNHGSDQDLDLAAIERSIRSKDLPLLPCRSKSGGAHLYVFGSEPLRADMLRTVLMRWMSDLQIEGSDCVFPKQSRLVMDSQGRRALGNWINLPYFNADASDRYMLDNGKPAPFDLFLSTAENRAVSQEQLESYFGSEHSEAPPCIQRALSEGIGEGSRNEAIFHITVYNKKRNPEGAREMSHAMQPEIFGGNALPFSEADKTIRSAVRRDYGYLCKKEPWSKWCDREACRKRKWGITETEYETLLADTKLPMFSDLVKYGNTEPVMWEIKMNGVPIMFTTDELMDYRVVRMRAVEKLSMMLPSKIKPAQWTDEILAGLMEKLTIEQAPIESTVSGVLQTRLHEFLKRADLKSNGEDISDRESLQRGMPVVQQHEGDRVIMFRSIDYEDFLKRTRTDIPRNKNLWLRANREMGVQFDRVRVKHQLVSVWWIPVNKIFENEFTHKDFSTEY